MMLELTGSGTPGVCPAWGQSQFGRAHPARLWQPTYEEYVGNKRASKTDSGPAYSCF